MRRLATLIPLPPDPAANHLAQDGASQGKRDDFPAVPGLHPQDDDQRDRDVDVKEPFEREFLGILAQISEGDVADDGRNDQADKHDVDVHEIHATILAFFQDNVNLTQDEEH